MDKFKYNLLEVEFVEPRSESEPRKKDEFAGVIYVSDPRVPKGLLKKIEKRFGPIPKGSYFTSNFSMYWEKLKADYKGEKPDGSRSVSNQYRLPNYSKVFKSFRDLQSDLKFLQDQPEISSDAKLLDIMEKVKLNFNEYRTHLRKNYPEQYQIIKMQGGLKESDELDEISGTGGGAGSATFSAGTGMQYATPYAFKKKKKKK